MHLLIVAFKYLHYAIRYRLAVPLRDKRLQVKLRESQVLQHIQHVLARRSRFIHCFLGFSPAAIAGGLGLRVYSMVDGAEPLEVLVEDFVVGVKKKLRQDCLLADFQEDVCSSLDDSSVFMGGLVWALGKRQVRS